MSSLLPTIQAKSDQLNAVDLIGGPRTVLVTAVKVKEGDEQPVAVSFEGDGGRPYKPCLTMRRLLANVWGGDTSAFPGRSMTLYNDPNVRFGRDEVGGIRISHMSHIDAARSFWTTISRGKKAQITVRPLEASSGQAASQGASAEQIAAVLHDAEAAAKGGKASFTAWWNSDQVKANGSWARKVVSGLLTGTENKLEALQEMAVQADAAAQSDDEVTEEDPFSASEKVA